MKQLLALLLFVPSLCLAQIPDYVPTDGLVGWWPFEGNAQDFSGFENHGSLSGPQLVADRYGIDSAAYHFDGSSSIEIAHTTSLAASSGITISCWFHPENPSTSNGTTLISKGQQWSHWNYGITLMPATGAPGYTYTWYTVGSGTTVLPGEWNHIAFTLDTQLNEMKQYTNGVLETSMFNLDTSAPTSDFDDLLNSCCNSPLVFGRNAGASSKFFDGIIDDVAIWDRALDSMEVMALFLGEPPIFGCTDLSACNYSDSASASDGSCVYGCLYCGEGTVWDSTLQECVGVVSPADSILVPIPSCGEGTVWDPVNEECIIAVPTDNDFDGCVSASDVLNLLANFGTCPPIPEWPEEPTENTWTCGDPLTYWDYVYATVLLGDQCWFAENLKTAVYENGDAIAAGLTDGEWTSTTSGATSTYGEGSSACYESSPDIDACDEVESLQTYGRLYNWYAVNDSRGLCPSDWHVPSDPEWTTLVDHVGAQDFNGSEGTALKAESAWSSGGNGTNDFGFTALPGGHRFQGPPTAVDDGTFNVAGYAGFWWSTTALNNTAWRYAIYTNNTIVGREDDHLQFGFSVRCVKD